MTQGLTANWAVVKRRGAFHRLVARKEAYTSRIAVSSSEGSIPMLSNSTRNTDIAFGNVKQALSGPDRTLTARNGLRRPLLPCPHQGLAEDL